MKDKLKRLFNFLKFLVHQFLILLIAFFFLQSCRTTRRVPDGKYLLEKNKIFVDDTLQSDSKLYEMLYQQPNLKRFSLGIPLRLHIYNQASPNKDSAYHAWLLKKPKRLQRLRSLLSQKQVDRMGVGLNRINEWIKKVGEPPSILEASKIKKSIHKLRTFYWNRGWFNVTADHKIDYTKDQKATVSYYINPKKPYVISDVTPQIPSKAVDSIYQQHREASLIKAGNIFRTKDIEKERERLTRIFRNSGLYYFEKEQISFDADTLNTSQKVHIHLLIKRKRLTLGDSVSTLPFTVHKISKVNIYTDYTYANRNKKPQDSVYYKNYHIYAFDRIKLSKKAITDAVLISPNEIFRDSDRVTTYKQINNLKMFKYPNIQYTPDPLGPKHSSLIANVLLSPRKKYSTQAELDLTTSNIQVFGIGLRTSFLIRNVFKGAELLEVSARGSVGASEDIAERDPEFFDISEIGLDVKLGIPKLFFPLKTDRIIPKYMSPTTNIIFGINLQHNVGLDRQNATGRLNYRWKPNSTLTHQLDWIDVQYVRNLNTNNYFNIYRNTYNELNQIATTVLDANSLLLQDSALGIPRGAEDFIVQSLGANPDPDLDAVQLQKIRVIAERKNRLTEDNLIVSSRYTFSKNNRNSLTDEDFSIFTAKIEFAGNILNRIAKQLDWSRDPESQRFNLFGVAFSQYAKLELNYIKHWDLGRKNVLAFKAFGGIAIPYRNSNSIPFVRSFFAGGPNDNRAWLAYDLGPGNSGGTSEFNEANMKLAANLEYRFALVGALQGAFFVDTGNIWNVLDNVTDQKAVFAQPKDFGHLAVGSGIGFRYDFDFFVLRFDIGFKTYNPSYTQDNRWFRGYNFAKAVYHLGINYPF